MPSTEARCDAGRGSDARGPSAGEGAMKTPAFRVEGSIGGTGTPGDLLA